MSPSMGLILLATLSRYEALAFGIITFDGTHTDFYAGFEASARVASNLDYHVRVTIGQFPRRSVLVYCCFYRTSIMIGITELSVLQLYHHVFSLDIGKTTIITTTIVILGGGFCASATFVKIETSGCPSPRQDSGQCGIDIKFIRDVQLMYETTKPMAAMGELVPSHYRIGGLASRDLFVGKNRKRPAPLLPTAERYGI
ncbi:hypothetical protein K449DRAFT_436164 [Hypoxylon sp. EC38]|nr:hypothetical protein K449DRAFT_436164 [Hypoxylon sp. EC38]